MQDAIYRGLVRAPFSASREKMATVSAHKEVSSRRKTDKGGAAFILPQGTRRKDSKIIIERKKIIFPFPIFPFYKMFLFPLYNKSIL